uniref:Serine-rich adhesin for platelets-like isoform X2 n=1 Tax=Hirondellea gigas TaxID=1518452 RepID=A0A6A7G5L9_9CRUS
MDLSANSSIASDSCNISTENIADKTHLRRPRMKRKERTERTTRRGRKPSQPDAVISEQTMGGVSANATPDDGGMATEKILTPAEQEQKQDTMKEDIKNNADNGIDASVNNYPTTKVAINDTKNEPCPAEKIDQIPVTEVKTIPIETAVSQIQTSVLHALGLTRGIGVGFANTLNLTKTVSVLASETNKISLTTGVVHPNTTLTKAMPLLVNMTGTAGSTSSNVSSIIPANLPPGRYVIISSTTAAAAPAVATPLPTLTTTTCNIAANTSTATTASLGRNNTQNNNGAGSSACVTLTPANHLKQNRISIVRNMTGIATTTTSQARSSLRTPVGRTRGMRKSYTTSEKLAMIEAVESGLKKSVVADRFGVAPSTLACIILQKDKIRKDQSKCSLSRRRIRPSSSSHNSSNQSKDAGSSSSDTAGQDLQGASSTNNFAAASNGMDAQSPPPFTHFLANFDQSLAFDNAPEEIVSVPDLSDSLPYSSTPTTDATYNESQEQQNSSAARGVTFGQEPIDLRQDDKEEHVSVEEDSTAEHVGRVLPDDIECLPTSHKEEEAQELNGMTDDTCSVPVLGDPAVPSCIETTDDVGEVNNTSGSSSIATAASTAVGGLVGVDAINSSERLFDPNISTTTTAGVTAPAAALPTSVPAATVPAGELSGLCLVKRAVHCYSVLDQLMRDQTYTDVTLTTDEHTFYAHKIVLCVASSYFRRVLSDHSPGVRSVIVLRDIPHNEMRNVLQFLYTGEATVDASELQSFMRTAQLLEITSLCDNAVHFPEQVPYDNDTRQNLAAHAANKFSNIAGQYDNIAQYCNNPTQYGNMFQVGNTATRFGNKGTQYGNTTQYLPTPALPGNSQGLVPETPTMHSISPEQQIQKNIQINNYKQLAKLQHLKSGRKKADPHIQTQHKPQLKLHLQKNEVSELVQQQIIQNYIQQHIKRQIESLTRENPETQSAVPHYQDQQHIETVESTDVTNTGSADISNENLSNEPELVNSNNTTEDVLLGDQCNQSMVHDPVTTNGTVNLNLDEINTECNTHNKINSDAICQNEEFDDKLNIPQDLRKRPLDNYPQSDSQDDYSQKNCLNTDDESICPLVQSFRTPSPSGETANVNLNETETCQENYHFDVNEDNPAKRQKLVVEAE